MLFIIIIIFLFIILNGILPSDLFVDGDKELLKE